MFQQTDSPRRRARILVRFAVALGAACAVLLPSVGTAAATTDSETQSSAFSATIDSERPPGGLSAETVPASQVTVPPPQAPASPAKTASTTTLAWPDSSDFTLDWFPVH
jgi:hypothetical protein